MHMIRIDASNRHKHCDLLNEVYRLRHAIFVDELRWGDLARPDGCEIDSYDTDTAVETILQADDGAVIGYQRFLPTTTPCLLSHVYPQLCDGSLPSAPDIYEWTRLTVVPSHRSRGAGFGKGALALMTSATEWALECNIRAFIAETSPALLHKFISNGFRVAKLGRVHQLDGEPVVAVRAEIGPDTLAKLRSEQRPQRL